MRTLRLMSLLGIFLGIAMITIVMIAAPPPAYAADRIWSAGTGGWSTPANWGGTEPTASDTAIINNAGTAQISASGEVASVLYLGQNASTTGNIDMSDGILTVTSTENIGYSGKGTFTQTGGTHNAGYLYVGYLSGSSGTYTQSAGVVSIGGYYILGYYAGSVGSYSLSGTGVINAGEYIGDIGTGTFTQSGGTNNAGWLYLGIRSGGSGTYTQSGGVVSIGTELILGYYPGATGSYTLSDTGVINATGKTVYIGNAGKGTFTQTGGTHNAGLLYVSPSSTYNLDGGYLSLGTLTKGAGPSAFNMSGGRLRMSSLAISNINFTGGALSVDTITGNLIVPNEGIISPGTSPGKTTVGDATFNAGSTLFMELGGLIRETQYDWLSSTNTTFAAGSFIELSLWNGYTPVVGDTFDIVTATGLITDNGLDLINPIAGGKIYEFSWSIIGGGLTGRVTLDAITDNSVPEPATIFTILGGLAMAAYRRVCKRVKKG